MIKKVSYICEKCKMSYSDEKAADKCEKSHFTPAGIKSFKYGENGDRKTVYPSSIVVELENELGEKANIEYKR